MLAARAKRIGFVILLFSLVSACGAPPKSPTLTPSAAPTPQVEITAWTASIEGTLLQKGECLAIRDSRNQKEYILVWPEYFTIKIEGQTVYVTSEMTQGQPKEYPLQIGQNVVFNGGATERISEYFQKTVPATCVPPYWIVESIEK